MYLPLSVEELEAEEIRTTFDIITLFIRVKQTTSKPNSQFTMAKMKIVGQQCFLIKLRITYPRQTIFIHELLPC